MTAIEDVVQLMRNAGIARGKIDSLTPDESLEEQGLDSFDRMSLLTEIEDQFDIDLPNETASKLKTINDIVDHINANK